MEIEIEKQESEVFHIYAKETKVGDGPLLQNLPVLKFVGFVVRTPATVKGENVAFVTAFFEKDFDWERNMDAVSSCMNNIPDMNGAHISIRTLEPNQDVVRKFH